MAHGTPDWGVTAGGVTVYQLTDLAEAVARLGSLDTFDRRGDLIWADDFERSLNKWVVGVPGVGAAVALSASRARNGRYSALLTAGSDAGFYTSMHHEEPLPVLGLVGFEFWFSLGSTIETLTAVITARDGVNSTVYQVRWDDAANEILYLDSAGVYQTLDTGQNLSLGYSRFHGLKVVVDLANREYHRVIFNDSSYPLADIDAQTVLSALVPTLFVEVQLADRVGFNDTVYVDDVILTRNEPA